MIEWFREPGWIGTLPHTKGLSDVQEYHRKMIRLLVGTCLLLFIAWVGLKLMQYRGDYLRMIEDFQRWTGSWSKRLGDFIESARRFIEPKLKDIGRFFDNLFKGSASGA